MSIASADVAETLYVALERKSKPNNIDVCICGTHLEAGIAVKEQVSSENVLFPTTAYPVVPPMIVEEMPLLEGALLVPSLHYQAIFALSFA